MTESATPTQSMTISLEEYDRGIRQKQVGGEAWCIIIIAFNRWQRQVLKFTPEYPAPVHVGFVEAGT